MTFLKRALTAIVLFPFLFLVLYFGICVAGAVAGAKAGAANPQQSFELGRQAGQNFVRHNLVAILLSSFGGSFVASLALSFSGILPWCRKPPQPPKIPQSSGQPGQPASS
jgi:hypothetical protein